MDSTTSTTAAEEQGVVFHSEASNYRIVREPQRRRQVGESNEFEVVGGREYQFYDGALRVTDADDIEWLRNYDSNGKFFWEVGSEADRPENSADVQAEIIQKALAGDFDSIADILVAERSATSRPEVISACEAALNAGNQELPGKPLTPLHEQQRVRMGPTAGVTPGVSPDPVPGSPQVDPSTLAATPGAPAPAEEPAVPVGQVPAEGETPEGVSDTSPNAQGPLTAGEPGQVGDSTATSDAPPVGSEEHAPAPAEEEQSPAVEDDAPVEGEGDVPPAETPSAEGDDGTPGAPATGTEG